jgi:hypothetical protein
MAYYGNSIAKFGYWKLKPVVGLICSKLTISLYLLYRLAIVWKYYWNFCANTVSLLFRNTFPAH